MTDTRSATWPRAREQRAVDWAVLSAGNEPSNRPSLGSDGASRKDVIGREARDSFLGWLRARLAARRQATQDASRGSEQTPERLSGAAACDICRRTMLLGEKTSRFRRDERVVDVCSLCEARILAQGFLREA